MFDFAWSELVLIGGVALILIGPKDLPVAIKAVSEMVKKARRMASEFQTHVDEMVRDADLQDVKNTFNDLRRMDIKGKILDAVDSDRSISKTLADNPFDLNRTPPPVPVPDSPAAAEAIEGLVHGDSFLTPAVPIEPAEPRAPPAFIPPGVAALGVPGPPKPPPSFVPPAAVALATANRRVPFA